MDATNAIVSHLIEAESKTSTLVIHLDDRTTDFLKAIYEGMGYPAINDRIPQQELLDQIEAYSRIYMLGHGCSAGLFGAGYVIGDEFGPALQAKKDGLYIWCHAEVYARKNKLSGLVSGMFISEVGEAAANGIKATQEEVNASNAAFAVAVRNYLDNGESPHSVKQCYNSATCKITQFNNARLFVMEGGVPLRPDGTPEVEAKREDDYAASEKEFSDLRRRVRQVYDIADNFLDLLGEGHIEQIYLIGSRYTGKASDDSDWDFLVVGEGFDEVESEKLRQLEAGQRIFGMRLDTAIKDRNRSNDIIFSSTPPKEGKLVYDGY